MSTDDALPMPAANLFEGSLLPDGGPLVRVHLIENQIEAMVLHDVLDGESIGHSIESYRDTAYDGLFQNVRGWGAVLVREENAEAAKALIKRALDELLAAPAVDEADEGSDGDP